nr:MULTISPECIES: hypothetical protein [Brucella]
MSRSMRGFRRRTTLSRSPSRPMRRWKRRKLKNEEQSAGNEPVFRSRSFHAPPGLYALVQDVGSAFAHPRAYFAGRHQKRDHRPGFRP